MSTGLVPVGGACLPAPSSRRKGALADKLAPRPWTERTPSSGARLLRAQQPDVTVAAKDSRDGGYRDLVRSIDASITRMAVLMLKLVGARIGLGVEHMRSSVPNYQLMLGGRREGAAAAAGAIDVPPTLSAPGATASQQPQTSAPQAAARSPSPSSPGPQPAPSSSAAVSESPWQTPRRAPSSSAPPPPPAGNSRLHRHHMLACSLLRRLPAPSQHVPPLSCSK